jgi:hypothetical protein
MLLWNLSETNEIFFYITCSDVLSLEISDIRKPSSFILTARSSLLFVTLCRNEHCLQSCLCNSHLPFIGEVTDTGSRLSRTFSDPPYSVSRLFFTGTAATGIYTRSIPRAEFQNRPALRSRHTFSAKCPMWAAWRP